MPLNDALKFSQYFGLSLTVSLHKCYHNSSILHQRHTFSAKPTVSLKKNTFCRLRFLRGAYPKNDKFLLYFVKISIRRLRISRWTLCGHVSAEEETATSATKSRCLDIRQWMWHSEDRASWCILIMKGNEMHFFSNLFHKVLYMFRTFPLSIISSISTLYTRNRYLSLVLLASARDSFFF
jgi:hypothetical protein